MGREAQKLLASYLKPLTARYHVLQREVLSNA